MSGYWPSSFFGVFMELTCFLRVYQVEVHKHAKTERG